MHFAPTNGIHITRQTLKFNSMCTFQVVSKKNSKLIKIQYFSMEFLVLLAIIFYSMKNYYTEKEIGPFRKRRKAEL